MHFKCLRNIGNEWRMYYFSTLCLSSVGLSNDHFSNFKDGPQLCVCSTWLRRPAGYNNSIPTPHIKVVPEPPLCAELECYCCIQMACAAKLHTNITEDRP